MTGKPDGTAQARDRVAEGRKAGGLNGLGETGHAGHSLRQLLPNRVDSRGGTWWIHRVRPFPVSGDPAHVLRCLHRVVAEMPRTEVVVATNKRLHAVARTLLGFRDDLEFHASPAEGVVHVRSASRIGVYDFGVNRRRVERVRKELARFS